MPAQDFPLPSLREDLQLLPGPVALDGSPTWSIYDPLRNRYFRLGWQHFQMITRWSAGTVANLVKQVTQQTTCKINNEDVLKMVRFLHSSSLTVASASGRISDYLVQYKAGRASLIKWLVHNYLFLRIPLFKPEQFLKRTLPNVSFLFSGLARNLILLIALSGLYLVSRQWDAFRATFISFLSWQGVLYSFCALYVAKILHELGHAYAATHYGCRVNAMGLAFVVAVPMLYTDVTDAWRLVSRRQRVVVGAAGMIVELSLAMICLLSWSFLPIGFLKSACFMLATVSIIATLTINFSPFMRFDGYYILSDWLGIDNLQSRSFELAKHRMREILFDLHMGKPEHLPVNYEWGMVVFSWCVWVYRLIIWTILSILIYTFFFKLLGIILFIVEIGYFIIMPIVKELAVWWGLRDEIVRRRRFWLWFIALLAGVIYLCLPLPRYLQLPAVLHSTQHSAVYSPEPAMIVELNMRNDQRVRAGDILAVLNSPKLDDEILRTETRIAQQQIHVLRTAANEAERQNMLVVAEETEQLTTKLEGLYARKEKLRLQAPFNGQIVDVNEALHVGRWVSRDFVFARLIDPGAYKIDALVAQADVRDVAVGGSAQFIPDDVLAPSVAATVSEVATNNETKIENESLASVFGGGVAAELNNRQELVPVNSVYRVRLAVQPSLLPAQSQSGIVRIATQPRSYLRRAYDSIAAVLIRESGF